MKKVAFVLGLIIGFALVSFVPVFGMLPFPTMIVPLAIGTILALVA